MTYEGFQAFADGEHRLKRMLPAAHAAAREGGYTAKARIPAAAALLPHVTDDNLISLMVYRVSQGWVADLILAPLPEGVPNRVGIPERDALPSEQDAENAGFDMLVGLLAVSEYPVFELCGHAVPLARSNLDNMRRNMTGPIGYESPEAAKERVGLVIAGNLPDGFSVDGFNALPVKQQRLIMAVLHLAALSGAVIYP